MSTIRFKTFSGSFSRYWNENLKIFFFRFFLVEIWFKNDISINKLCLQSGLKQKSNILMCYKSIRIESGLSLNRVSFESVLSLFWVWIEVCLSLVWVWVEYVLSIFWVWLESGLSLEYVGFLSRLIFYIKLKIQTYFEYIFCFSIHVAFRPAATWKSMHFYRCPRFLLDCIDFYLISTEFYRFP